MKGSIAQRIRRKAAVERLEYQHTHYTDKVREIKEALKTARNHKDRQEEQLQEDLLRIAEDKLAKCKTTLDNTNRLLKAASA